MGGRGRSRPAEGYFTELPADDKKDAAASAIEDEEEEDEEATVDGSDVDEETEDLEELDGEEEEEAEDLTSSSGRGRGKKRGRPLGSKGKKKKIEKLPGAPDRPQNAYMLYLADYRRTHAETISKIPAKEVSKIVGERWKALTEEEKAMYEERAEKESEAYQVALAEFKEENPHFQRKKRRKRHPGEPIKKTYVGNFHFRREKKKKKKKKTLLFPPHVCASIILNLFRAILSLQGISFLYGRFHSSIQAPASRNKNSSRI